MLGRISFIWRMEFANLTPILSFGYCGQLPKLGEKRPAVDRLPAGPPIGVDYSGRHLTTEFMVKADAWRVNLPAGQHCSDARSEQLSNVVRQ